MATRSVKSESRIASFARSTQCSTDPLDGAQPAAVQPMRVSPPARLAKAAVNDLPAMAVSAPVTTVPAGTLIDVRRPGNCDRSQLQMDPHPVKPLFCGINGSIRLIPPPPRLPVRAVLKLVSWT